MRDAAGKAQAEIADIERTSVPSAADTAFFTDGYCAFMIHALGATRLVISCTSRLFV